MSTQKSKTSKNRKLPKVGDVAEIETARGLAYAQYTHHDRNLELGALLALLPGVYQDRPDNIESLVNQPEMYYFFYPLRAAVQRDFVKLVGNFPVPAFRHPFPLFRRRGDIARSGKTLTWFLWDGQVTWRVDALTEDQKKLNIAGVFSHKFLVERIEEGWLPSEWP